MSEKKRGKEMSRQQKYCSFEFALNDVLTINQPVNFPPFTTSLNMKWNFSFHPYDDSDNTMFRLTLKPKTQEITSVDSNIYYNVTSIIMFTKSLFSNSILKCGAISVKRARSNGIILRCPRSSLVNNMILGVNLFNFPFNETYLKERFFQPEPHPKNLISAWSNEINNPDQTDVKFIVQGECLYARSSILSARSDYFRSMFNGNWKETRRNSLNDESDDEENRGYKYVIEITDFDFKTVFSMLRYFYTDEIFIDEGCTNRFNHLWSLFSISDKYLLDDLRKVIKFQIIDRLDINNAAEILFNHAWKWPDLKGYVIKFMVENIKNVRNSKGYKNILVNYLDYPNFHELHTEIFLKLYPDDESESD